MTTIFPCRAVSLEGEVHAAPLESDAGAAPMLAVTLQSEIPPDVWLSLGRGARLAAKDPRTTRETIFYGPGRVRACAAHREESWVASGSFESEPGAGESPGAQEWVVTPQAVLRFAAAKIRVTVHPGETTAVIATGVAFVWAGAGTRERIAALPQATDGGGAPEATVPEARGNANGNGTQDAGTRSSDVWKRVTGGTLSIKDTGSDAPAHEAEVALNACSAIAARSEELTRELLAPHGTNAAGGIAEQVSTRELARAACAVAGLTVAALPEGAARTPLEERLREAEEAWTAVPTSPGLR